MTLTLRLCALALLSLSQLACSSMRTVIADFDIDGSARIVDSAGQVMPGTDSQLIKVPAPERRISRFADLRYDSAVLSTTLTLNSDTLDGMITNKGRSALTLRFDQATASSSAEPADLPLAVFHATIRHTMVSVPKGENRLAAVPALALQPGEQAPVLIVPSYARLFPSRRLFGVRFVGNTPELAETGVGNTLTLRVPVEYEGARSIWVMHLTATQTSVRSSYR